LQLLCASSPCWAAPTGTQEVVVDLANTFFLISIRKSVGVGAGGEMTQALYAHMNNKIKKKKEECS
jgi:hypothetical protein